MWSWPPAKAWARRCQGLDGDLNKDVGWRRVQTHLDGVLLFQDITFAKVQDFWASKKPSKVGSDSA